MCSRSVRTDFAAQKTPRVLTGAHRELRQIKVGAPRVRGDAGDTWQLLAIGRMVHGSEPLLSSSPDAMLSIGPRCNLFWRGATCIASELPSQLHSASHTCGASPLQPPLLLAVQRLSAVACPSRLANFAVVKACTEHLVNRL